MKMICYNILVMVISDKVKENMKKLIISFAVMLGLASSALPALADSRTYTERECSTDSYGNTTCRDKTINIETGVITYSNHTVNGYATGSSSGGYITYGQAVTGQSVNILNTGLPTGGALIAGVVVALGSLSLALKVLLRQVN